MPVRVIRWSVVLVVALSLSWTPLQGQRPPALPDLLKTATDALAQHTRDLGAVAADEEFMQYDTASGRMGTPKRLGSVVVFYTQSNGSIATFRDLAAIDTVLVRPKDDRLAALFKSPVLDASLASAQSLTEDAVNAYYSPNLRILDNPMIALNLLRTANEDISSYKAEGTKTMNGTQVVVLRFTEKGKGRLMADAKTIARFWIDLATGAVHQTELGFAMASANILSTVKFSKDSQLGLFVPSELFEQVEASAASTGINNMGAGGNASRLAMEGRARYSGYRRLNAQP
jgi:hypothetical protein